ncbi:YpsA SLOG family protein [Thermodesulfobacteriota bacterium]
MLKKIISGRPTDAGRGAVDVAEKLGIPNNAASSNHRFIKHDQPSGESDLTKNDATSDLNNFEQHIIASDGTLIMSHGSIAQTVGAVQDCAQKYNRPFIHINLDKIQAFKASRMITSWIRNEKIEILNVTGSDAGDDPKIYQKTRDIIESVYHLDLIDENMFDLERELSKQPSEPPQSVDAAVERLISELPLKDRVSIANMTYGELDTLDSTLGEDIRFEFGLWNKNVFLIDSCRFVSGEKHLNPNSASKIIIDLLWKRLRETHKLRIINGA